MGTRKEARGNQAKGQQHGSQKHLEKSKQTLGEELRNTWNLISRRSRAKGVDWVMDTKQ